MQPKLQCYTSMTEKWWYVRSDEDIMMGHKHILSITYTRMGQLNRCNPIYPFLIKTQRRVYTSVNLASITLDNHVLPDRHLTAIRANDCFLMLDTGEKCKNFHAKKRIWKCRLLNGGHFCVSLNELTAAGGIGDYHLKPTHTSYSSMFITHQVGQKPLRKIIIKNFNPFVMSCYFSVGLTWIYPTLCKAFCVDAHFIFFYLDL